MAVERSFIEHRRTAPPTERKGKVRQLADQQADERYRWVEKNRAYYEDDLRYMRFLVPPGKRVLDLGCSDGRLLAALEPSRGVGVDLSPEMVRRARSEHPHFEFHVGDIEEPGGLDAVEGTFDFIVLSDTVGSLDDAQGTLSAVHRFCDRNTRLVVAYYNRLWAPLLWLAQRLGLQMPSVEQNWLAADQIAALMQLADFEPVSVERRQLVPLRLLGLGRLINRFIGTLPFVDRLALRSYVVGRSLRKAASPNASATVIIPCRNEAGNVRPAVERMPRFCNKLEIIFVEGHSSDDTLDEVNRVIEDFPQLDIKVTVQDGSGKADAVWKGFAMAKHDFLMILDGDLTVPPEDLPKFYEALASGRGEFVMGSRLVYPMEDDAMRFLNSIGNKLFSWIFSWLLKQRITDTLCGTKVLRKSDYQRIDEARSYFGDFDPFGDFDLIFGASKQRFRILEIPVRYRARVYGSTQISRFRHGWLLVKMVRFAYARLKAF